MTSLSPNVFTRINFVAATAFVRSYDPKGNVSRGSHSHGSQRVTLNKGYIIIDQAWRARKQEPIKEIPELTKKRERSTKGRKR